MFDLHIFSRFLRLVRSIRRSLLALFVAIAMLLATFVIAPAYALSAGENGGGRTNTEQTEGAKADGAGGAKADAVQKQSVQQSEPNKTESDKKNTDTSSNLKKNNNKVLKPDTKQQPDSNKAGNKAANKAKSDDKAKSADKTGKTVEKSAESKSAEKSAANKKAKDSKKKGADSAEANGNGTDRSENDEPKLPEECGSKPFKRCYVVSYYNDKSVVDNNHPVLIQRGNTITIKPKFEIKSTKKSADMPSGVWFELGKYDKPVPSWVNFKKTENQKSFDGSITLSPNSKWDYGSYKFKVFAYYKKKSEKIYATISVKVDVPDISKNDLSLSLYDFGKTQDNTAIKDSKIIINPKSKGSDSSGSDTGGTGKKDVYDPINNKLFIDSQSKYKPGSIYHHMICKTGSGDDASYTLDSVNGLSLSTQAQFTHKENKDRPDKNAEKSAVYENDPYTERSQSWITGTPTKAGTFECKVFAIKDVDISYSENLGKTFSTEYFAKYVIDRLKDKTREVFSDPDTKIYAAHIPNTNTSGLDESVYKPQKTIDWAYKSVTIEVKSSEPQKPTIGKNDLTLKVYPFKDSTTALTSSNNDIYAMLGTELKPYIDATSLADSANKITLRVLCSKGEKKGSGSQPVQPSGSTQPAQPSESPQDSKDLEYKTWSSNLAELGLSVPNDTDQTRCKKGDKDCTAAAQTTMEMSIKPSIEPTAVGDYQCVVYALKTNAFNAQSGKQTPAEIDKALAGDKSLTETKDFAAFTLNIHLSSNFTLPNTGGQSWNLQLGILAALLVNLLAAGFVVSQSEKASKLILGRWRGLCNYV